MRITMDAMPIPLGIYQITQGALAVTSSTSSSSHCQTRLPLNATVEIVETLVEERSTEGSRVRGLVRATSAGDGAGGNHDEHSNISNGGWITLFEVRSSKMRMYAHPKQQT